MTIDGSTVAIEGFGKIGGSAAKAFSENGAKIVAISTQEGAISRILAQDLRPRFRRVNAEKDKLYATGSRTIAALGIADTIVAAEQIAENIIKNIIGPLFHRKDIGTVKLINKKIQQINKLCATNYKLL